MSTMQDATNSYKECPHCLGQTVCDCASCGAEQINRRRKKIRIKGICQVCSGLGQVRK